MSDQLRHPCLVLAEMVGRVAVDHPDDRAHIRLACVCRLIRATRPVEIIVAQGRKQAQQVGVDRPHLCHGLGYGERLPLALDGSVDSVLVPRLVQVLLDPKSHMAWLPL